MSKKSKVKGIIEAKKKSDFDKQGYNALKENFIIPLKQKNPHHIINGSNNAKWSYWALRGHYGIDPPHNYLLD